MAHYLDIDTWKRRDHFWFFRRFDRPFFNLTAPVPVDGATELARERGLSFFLTTLYLTLRAINEVEPFRYRLRGDRVIVHDVIHGGCTVLREDETFGFAYYDYDPDFERFHAAARERLDAARVADDLDPTTTRDDLIHCSAIPWVAFTGFEHARTLLPDDSIPKIAFGKRHTEGGGERIPVSVSAHHALMDGLAVGRLFERLEQYFVEPPISPPR